MPVLSLTRRRALRWGAGAGAAALAPLPVPALASRAVEVWKDPNCGCCNDWIAYLQRHGLQPVVHEAGRAEARARLGLPERYASCHTAQVGGYVVEGHVAVPEIKRLLQTRPQALGIAVPGMPIGSPGMDGPAYGGRREPYETLLVFADGSNRVFARHT